MNTEYYQSIFKKTEKIVCAVFYIIRHNAINKDKDRVIEDVERTASRLLDASLDLLNAASSNIDQHAVSMRNLLVELESRMRVLNAASLLSSEFLHVFVQEIDGVLRSLKTYRMSSEEASLAVFQTDSNVTSSETSQHRRKSADRVKAARNTALLGGKTASKETGNRKDRIVKVLQETGDASIKDISDVITDCSEKTIQRELNTMIKDGLVIREGQRRWSKYNLV